MLFEKIISHAPKTLAICHAEGALSYQDFQKGIQLFVAHLQGIGIRKGNYIGIVSENSPELVLLFPALWQLGAITVPISPRFPEAQVRKLLKNSGCNGLLMSEKCLAASAKACVNSLFYFQRFSSDAMPKALFQKMKTAKTLNFCEENPTVEGIPLQTETDLAQRATVIFTSGSSGSPKGALHTLGNHYYSALGSNRNIPFGPGDCWLLSLPLYHVGGLAILIRAWIGGGGIALPDSKISLGNALEIPGITHLSLVATQLFRLMKSDTARKKLANLKAILLGGSAIPAGLIREAATQNLPTHTSYGSTEMSSQITTTPPGASLETLLTSGKLLSHRELKIAADGEIFVSGKTCFQGYVENGKLNPAQDEGGWFHTGDRGKIDAAGRLIVIGRKDNMFISGGENIQPEAIEKVLSRITGVGRCIVVPVGNTEFGMRPVAFVEMIAGGHIDEKKLRAALLKKMAKFNIPDHFFPWPQNLPENELKINRAFFTTLAARRVDVLSASGSK